ncbi:MAG: helix-turn-helix transcriptional regulator [Phascolarctobacterium sp.]|uniref:helix-turn-helix domain-containing protein n=1 Tax=Phascolarctobacterium sp. TaxID=2049039 RepID=UPI0026DA8920|nr:helix-turn-helix transcriptional regulator [Phascolarctobacterium sp.]MDO4920221.1 helix-turn-helix transcriptional regulator [Phascolarctobacterium sp.]
MNFGECLKAAREKAGLSQKELGQLLLVPASMIGRYETTNTEPRIGFIIELCKVLNITPNELLNYKTSTEQEYISLLSQYGISVTKGTFTEYLSFKDAVKDNKSIVNGYILNHLETGVNLNLAATDFFDFVKKLIAKGQKAANVAFRDKFAKELNAEIFSDYAFVSQEEIFEEINNELEALNKNLDIEKIKQIKNKIRYLEAFYYKLAADPAFRNKIYGSELTNNEK